METLSVANSISKEPSVVSVSGLLKLSDMRLKLGTFKVTDVVSANKTIYKDGILSINIPEMEEIINSDRQGVRPFEDPSTIPEAFKTIARRFLDLNEK